MKKEAREALDAYYHEADSWAGDREAHLRGSRRIAWIVAGLAGTIAVFEACALVFMAPLKTVVPYTLMVDRQTGFVQALKPVDGDKIAPDSALTQSFLVQYVIARESFDIDGLQSNYRKAFLWSADRARADYVAAVQVSNPDSPLAQLPRSTLLTTRVKSVSSLGATTALVRFETQRRDAGGQVSPPGAFVAVITWRYSAQAMSTEDRYINPLGFQVVRYNRNAESLVAPETAAPVDATPPVTTPLPPGPAVQPPVARTVPQRQPNPPGTVDMQP